MFWLETTTSSNVKEQYVVCTLSVKLCYPFRIIMDDVHLSNHALTSLSTYPQTTVAVHIHVHTVLVYA